MATQRSIVKCIILSIITCSFYSLYWWACINDEVNAASGRHGETSGLMVIVFSILTCGIYALYWNYTVGTKLDELRVRKGQPAGSFALMFLILSFFGFTIVSLAISQNELNNHLQGI